MKRMLRRLIASQQFNPGLLGAFVNPFFLARRALWRAMRDAAGDASGRLLDVGCGVQPYRSLFRVDDYIGLEIDSPMARARGVANIYYDGTTFPLPDGEIDTVLCNQVLEHVFNPDMFLEELRRVLAPGGTLILSVPFVWDEHEQPYDFARYSTFGLRAMLEQHGFSLVKQDRLLDDFSVLLQLTNAWIYKVTQSKTRWIRRLITVAVMAPLSLAGLALGRLLPRNEDLFLDQVVVARRDA